MADRSLALLICLPVLAGLFNLVLPRLLQKLVTVLAMVAGLAVLVGWHPEAASLTSVLDKIPSGMIRPDSLSKLALIAAQVLSAIICLFSLKGVNPKIERNFFILFPITLGLTNGALLFDHALGILFFWGLSGIPLYLFASMGGPESPRVAQKTFLIVGGGDAFLILAFVLLKKVLPEAGWAVSGMKLPLQNFTSVVIFVSLIIAAATKAGVFPFHTWVPEYCQEAPVESVALLPASLDKILGIYLFTRTVCQLFSLTVLTHLILITLGAVTIITAVMMALVQHEGRKLLGYHAVSQVGYMIMGVGSGIPIAMAGGLFHMINHTIYKSNLFLALGSVEKRTGTHELENLGGLGRKMPVTMIMAMIGAFSISGIPPFNGFFSKWMIYQGLIEKAKSLNSAYEIWLLICLILAIFGSALTLASFLKYFHTIFLGRLPQKYNKIKEAPVNQVLSTGMLSLICLLFGLFAVEIPLKHFIMPVLTENGLTDFNWIGLYDSKLLLILTAFIFVVGMIVYLMNKKVRIDDIYLGGMDALEKFRVSGTEFYREIRLMSPFRQMYGWAEARRFDIYTLIGRSTLRISHMAQAAHTGSLSLYILFVMAGLLLLILAGNRV